MQQAARVSRLHRLHVSGRAGRVRRDRDRSSPRPRTSAPRTTSPAASADAAEAGSTIMATEHIVKSYDEELKRLSATITRDGRPGREPARASPIEALRERDTELAAARSIDDDAKVDALEREVDDLAVRLLALRQPMAVDLREIVAALKIASDLERIGDYAANVAKRVDRARPRCRRCSRVDAHRRAWARLAQQIIKDVLDAYVERDADKAVAVWQRDEELDEIYTSLFRELLTYMMEDPRNISAVHASAVHRQEHRAHRRPRHQHRRDRATSWCRAGRSTRARPKGDSTSLRVVATASERGAKRRRRCQPDEPARAGRRGRGRARRRCCATTSSSEGFRVAEAARRRGGAACGRRATARPRAARLDAAADVGHRGLPPAAPPARDRATCRSSC